MLIYVLRHGITQWNKLKKVQGAMDIPLAPEGIELAKRTGEALKDVPFDICFTSPLARARQTAHYVLGNRQIPVIEDKRIQEIDFGVLEGSRFKDEQGKIISHEMEIFFEEPQKFERPQNGENISDTHQRILGGENDRSCSGRQNNSCFFSWMCSSCTASECLSGSGTFLAWMCASKLQYQST